MNWKRIWTGTLLAGLAFFCLDFLINHVLLGAAWQEAQSGASLKVMKPYAPVAYAAIALGIGFILTWLYALARPRLGPGPRTALKLGTGAWFLIYMPLSLNYLLCFNIPTKIPLTYLVAGLLQCWVAIYLAGWQYIERAP